MDNDNCPIYAAAVRTMGDTAFNTDSQKYYFFHGCGYSGRPYDRPTEGQSPIAQNWSNALEHLDAACYCGTSSTYYVTYPTTTTTTVVHGDQSAFQA